MEDVSSVNGRSILFPTLHNWSDIFEHAEPYPLTNKGWQSPAPSIKPHTFKVGPKPGEVCKLGPFTVIETRSREWEHTRVWRKSFAYARLKDSIAAHVMDSTIAIEDSLSYQVIEWSDGRAIVIADHGRIIGSLWLALIDATTIPTDLR